MGVGHPFDQLAPTEAERWLGREHFHRAPDTESSTPVLEQLDESAHVATPPCA
jgi:hypothetical protein